MNALAIKGLVGGLIGNARDSRGRGLPLFRAGRRGVKGAVLLLTALLTACAGQPRRAPEAPDRTGAASISRSAEARRCRAQLSAAGAQFSLLPDLSAAPGCEAVNTLTLMRLASDDGTFAVGNLSRVSCSISTSFAAWARYGVDRAARQILGSKIARIETFGSYACRNVAGSNRRSAHANADAIDVSAFVLEDGRRIAVLGGWNGGSEAERRFLRIVHDSACKRMGTVLGPDYNAAHRDHFHLETRGGGFCR